MAAGMERAMRRLRVLVEPAAVAAAAVVVVVLLPVLGTAAIRQTGVLDGTVWVGLPTERERCRFRTVIVRSMEATVVVAVEAAAAASAAAAGV